MEIYVGNLPAAATASELHRFFQGYGRCAGFMVLDKLVNGRMVRCAYGVIEPDEEAQRAINELHLKPMGGQALMVMEYLHRDYLSERRAPDWRARPWPHDERRGRQRWTGRPWVAMERRQTDRRHDERRGSERRVIDRRSPAQAPSPHPLGEERFNEHRRFQRRVGERRAGTRRHEQRRSGRRP